MKNLFAIFVRTGAERKTVQYLDNELEKARFAVFVPLTARRFRSHGRSVSRNEVLFPGYIFIESDLESVDFILDTQVIFQRSSDIHGVVNSKNDYNLCTVAPKEREILLTLCGREDSERVIDVSEGFIIGDQITVTDGPLLGLESCIRKIDRHKRTAVIELQMLGELREVTIGLEIVQKIN